MKKILLSLGVLLLVPTSLCAAEVTAEEFAALAARTTRLEKSILQNGWTCSIKCIIETSPNKTYKFTTVKIGSAETLREAFDAATTACDSYFSIVKSQYSYTFWGGTYDENNNANISKNCVASR